MQLGLAGLGSARLGFAWLLQKCLIEMKAKKAVGAQVSGGGGEKRLAFYVAYKVPCRKWERGEETLLLF